MTPLRWTLLGAAAALVVGLLVVLVVSALPRMSYLDEPDTYWASGFTERAFDGVAPGTPRERAEEALGAPLVVVCAGDRSEVWQYSERATGPARTYEDVSLRFGSDGLLAEKISRVVTEEPAWPGRVVVLPQFGGHAVGACGSR